MGTRAAKHDNDNMVWSAGCSIAPRPSQGRAKVSILSSEHYLASHSLLNIQLHNTCATATITAHEYLSGRLGQL